MTFEERIERLTERHEALAQSVEMLLIATRENSENIARNTENIARSTENIARNTENIARNTENIARNTENIAKLVEVTNQDAENIRALARIAETHERRLDRLEGGR